MKYLIAFIMLASVAAAQANVTRESITLQDRGSSDRSAVMDRTWWLKVLLRDADETVTGEWSFTEQIGAPAGLDLGAGKTLIYDAGDARFEFNDDVNIAGDVTANTFTGDGAGLTGVPLSGIARKIEDEDADTGVYAEAAADEDVVRVAAGGQEVATFAAALATVPKTLNLTAASALQVGGTQVLSSARALTNITNLDVSGTAKVGTAGTYSNARLRVAPGSMDAYPSLGTTRGGLTLGGSFGLDIGVRGTGNSWIQVHRFDGTPTAYNLILQPSGGNVGIGTETPTEMLDVNGDTRVKSGTLQVGSTSNAAYNRIGTGATNRGLNAATQLFVEGNVEVDGTLYADGESVLSGTVYLGGPSGSQYGRIFYSPTPGGLVLHSEADLTLFSSTGRVRVSGGSGSMDFNGLSLEFGGLGLTAVNPGLIDVSSVAYAVLFVDSTDGDLKVRFPNGTVKTIATND